MSTFGQACLACRKRPSIRTDGLCAGCGADADHVDQRMRYGRRDDDPEAREKMWQMIGLAYWRQAKKRRRINAVRRAA